MKITLYFLTIAARPAINKATRDSFLFVSYLCATLACSKGSLTETTLSYTVNSFSAPVTSLSPSEQNDSIQYIGYEHGNVGIKNIYTDKQVIVDAGNNRIYDVKEYTKGILLVGIRDEGLKAVYIDASGEKTGMKTYSIGGKGTNYGVYSIARNGETFIIGTSNGCFTFQNPEDTVLQPYHAQLRTPHHYGFNKVLSVGGKVYMASDSALFVGDDGLITDTLLRGEIIMNLFHKDSLLYLSTRNAGIWQVDIRHLGKAPQLCSGHRAYAYVQDPLGGEWIVNSNEIIYRPPGAQDTVVQHIPQGVSISGKQMIYGDKDFIFLACGDQLYTFSVRQNMAGERGSVIALGSRNRSVYFLSGDNKLYEYRRKGSHAQLLGKVKGLNIRDNIIRSEIKDDYFWIATDKTLFKIHIPTSRLASAMPINPPGQSAQNDIRCLFFDNDTTLYIGARFNLYATNPSDDADNIRLYDKLKDPRNDLYVTAMCRIADTLYVGTLNKGLFAIGPDGSVDTLIAGNSYGNIRSLPVEDGQLYVHTSKNLYRYIGTNHMEALSNILPGGSKHIRSFVADNRSQTVAVLGNHGFAQLRSLSKDTCRELSYRDITFNNAAFAFYGDSSFVIGNRTGLYHYDGNLLSTVSLKPENVFPWTSLLWASLYLTSVLLIFFFGIGRPQKVRRHRLNDFLRRIDKYLTTAIDKRIIDHPSEKKLREQVCQLRDRIEQQLEGNYISHKTANDFSDELYAWEELLDNKTISYKEPAEAKRQEIAKRLELDRIDLEIIEFLANEKSEHRTHYRAHPRMVEHRQENIAIKLDCGNRKHYVVSAAYQQGLLILPHK
jgi:hypothetical protein